MVVGGYDFVGDKYNGSNYAVPDNDPMDCQVCNISPETHFAREY